MPTWCWPNKSMRKSSGCAKLANGGISGPALWLGPGGQPERDARSRERGHVRLPGEWKLCRNRGCPDPDSRLALHDRSQARRWLQSTRYSSPGIAALRNILAQERTGLDLSRTSDDAVIEQLSELLISGRFHVHVVPFEMIRGGATESTVPEASVPVPPRKSAPASSSPAEQDDPPTFPPDTDAAAQAATLVAASDSGAAVCPT